MMSRTMTVTCAWSAAVVAATVFLPASAFGQATVGGSIAGVVRDTTGAVLPGVTVEATSPALIEKVRTVVTDDQGQYSIVDLRPGVYTVTFALPGFSTVKRDSVELTTGFAATINAELRVGAVEETVTVSGASPVVDTHNVRQQNVLTREVLDALPARTSTQGFAAVTLGAAVPMSRQDVGGSSGEFTAGAFIHGFGGGESTTNIDGTRVQLMFGNGGGGVRWYKVNQIGAEEVTLQTGAVSADSETGGFVQNVVPREGGNAFKVNSLVNYTGDNFQSTNVTDELTRRGLRTPPSIKLIYDAGAGFGGPMIKDKLWFYTAHRRWGTDEQQPGNYYNASADPLFYAPDLSRPTTTVSYTQDHSVRLTWQASAKHKFSATNSFQKACACRFSLAGTTKSAEAGTDLFYTVNLTQASWNYPATSRLLFDAGVANMYSNSVSKRVPGVGGNDRAVTELSTGVQYGSYLATLNGISAYTLPGPPNYSNSFLSRASMAYVTGSHVFKVGLNTMSGLQSASGRIDLPSYSFRTPAGGGAPIPASLTLYASPHWNESRVRLNMGLYAQDQWTIRRLTLNYGIRFDRLDAYNPEQLRPGGEWVAPLPITRQNTVPTWNDVAPRFGVAYDVFGTGRTAVKASFGRYVALESTTIAFAANPANAMVLTTDRTWNDQTYPQGDPRRSNYVPDCDLRSPVANGECGGFVNNRFGTVNVNTRYADAITSGWGVRPFSWQTNVSLQQELRPQVALNVAYYRTWTKNFFATDNTLVGPGNFNEYCITTPTDTRLPGGGGQQLCGLYDVAPTSFGQVNNLITSSSDFGEQSLTYNGLDLAVTTRFGQGGLFTGGLSTGQSAADACGLTVGRPDVTATMALPSGNQVTGPSYSSEFCRVTLPWEGQTQVKFSGAYPLPWWGLQAAGTFQNLPGLPITASYVASNQQVASSLGRNLAACPAAATCTATATIAHLFAPNTRYEKRLTQLDVRLSKRLNVGRARLIGMFDIYNLLNASTITALNTRYGSAWLTPTSILPARLFKVGAQLDF